MYCKTELAMKLKPSTAFLIFYFSQISIINGQNDYLFITQPPSDLLCNPHSSNSNTSLRLECSIAVLGSTELPADTSIMWYRRAPESTEEQLCGSTVAKFMAASLFADKSVGLRSIIEVRGSSSRDLLGEYWCRVAKIGINGNTLLSNRSTVLEIRTREYYRNKDLSRCEAGTIFLELISSLQSVEFSSSSPLISAPCPVDPILSSPECSTVDPDSISGEMDDTFSLPRMWVYILAPVIATLLIFLFLFLLIALVVTCFQKRDPKKRLASTIANIELAATSNSDSQIKSSILAGKSPSVSSFGKAHMSATQKTSTAPIPIPRHSSSAGSALQCHVDLVGKQLQQHNNSQSGDEDQKSESDKEEEDYIEVPSMKDRKAAKVIGMLRGACNAEHSPTAERGSNGAAVNAGNFEYRSLDPDAMEPPHTYLAMQSANTTTASDGPQPMYSEPGGIHGHQKVVPMKKQRPPPPLKIPPRRDGNRSKPVQHKPIQSVPSADGEYVDPNNCNSPNNNNSPILQNMYQGLTPNKLEYLALYATPDSTPH